MSEKVKILVFVLTIVAAITATICYSPGMESSLYGLETGFYKAPIKPQDVKLLFVGDLMFDRGIRYYAKINGGNNFIFEKIALILLENDLVVANLEGSITNFKSVSAGTAPGSANNYFLTFDSSVAQTLFDNNIRLVDLGNNHILNFGAEGLKQTQQYLTQANVKYFGAPYGKRSQIQEMSGLKIAFVAYNEFASSDLDGEQADAVSEISELRQQADVVIVFAHWGVEYSAEPTKDQMALAHKFVDAGANLVIGSHPHVVASKEEYNGKMIYYSLGNFIFDQYFQEDVRNGLGVAVEISPETKEIKLVEKHFYLQSGGQTIEKTKQK